MVPVVVANTLRTAIMRLSGPALTRFAAQIGSRLGISVSGNASLMASRLHTYITSNPMSAGLVAASLAVSSPSFSASEFLDEWAANTDSGEVPEQIKFLLEQVQNLADNRKSITGDQDSDEVMGIEVSDLRKAAQVLQFGDRQIELLIRHFGSVDEVSAVRAALLAIDDEQLALYKERHGARRY